MQACQPRRRRGHRTLPAILSSCRRTAFSPYYRQRLCEALEDPSKAEKLSIHPKEWYEAQRFDLRLNHKVSGILPDEKAVVLWDGGRIRYDRLILATGSTSFVPPIKGGPAWRGDDVDDGRYAGD